MKSTRNSEKFIPVTLTIETADELRVLCMMGNLNAAANSLDVAVGEELGMYHGEVSKIRNDLYYSLYHYPETER